MKNVKKVIIAVTLFAAFYNLSPYIGIPEVAIYAMFLLSPFAVIYMVYITLKYGKPSKYTFKEKFYDDLDYYRS